MPTYLTLYQWTDQGVRDLKDTLQRAEQARSAVEKAGGRVLNLLWTQGAYDLVSISEFPDEETAAASALALARAGSVRTQTSRAFTADEMSRILQKLP